MARDLFGVDTVDRPPHVVDGVTLDLVLHHETHTDARERGAVLVSVDGDERHATWLEKWRIDIARGGLDARGARRNGQLVRLPVVTVTIPEALAREKGLL